MHHIDSCRPLFSLKRGSFTFQNDIRFFVNLGHIPDKLRARLFIQLVGEERTGAGSLFDPNLRAEGGEFLPYRESPKHGLLRA